MLAEFQKEYLICLITFTRLETDPGKADALRALGGKDIGMKETKNLGQNFTLPFPGAASLVDREYRFLWVHVVSNGS